MSDFVTNNEDEAKEYYSNYKFLYFIVALTGCVIAGRLWYLQIMQGAELRQYSEKNRVKETKIPSPRGLILDREGRVLVDNLPGFEATISPQYATRLDDTSEAVGSVLNIPGPRISSDVIRSRRRDGPFKPVRVKDNLSLDHVFSLKMLRWDHPGLNINESILRYYPLQENGAQLFGYVSEISREQIPKYNAKYTGKFNFEQGDIIGKSGLEEAWEESLRGIDGVTYIEVDARGREAASETPSYFGFEPLPAKPGSNLVLTIDKDIQEAAYKAMSREDALGKRIGGVVVMKTNGEILAWVNTPSFDPNKFSTEMTSQIWSTIINDPFKPLRNKVIQDHFSPGSTFKPIVAVAALQEKIITPSTIVAAPAFIKFGRRVYHDHTRTGHGYVSVAQAIERSSNVFFYKMGISLGIDKMAAYAKLLGLGARTNINIGNEVAGLVPTSEWKIKALGEEWQPGENLSNAIGQGFVLATALQMAVAYNTIGTEGQVVKPFIVKQVINQDNKVTLDVVPQVLRDASDPNNGYGVSVDKKVFQTVKEGLRRVVNGEHGTARGSKIAGFEMAGKTGTSQVMSFSAEEIYDKCETRPIFQRHHGWFVGFAPADKPEISFAVLAQHACHGSSGGAPVAKDIVLAYLQKYHPDKYKAITERSTNKPAKVVTPNVEVQE